MLLSFALNQWCAKNGIEKIESPPYHQQSNGVAERGVQTIKCSLVAWRLELAHLPFVEYLKRVLLHHHACFRRRDGRTPAEVVFGRNLHLPLTSRFGFGEAVQVQAGGKVMRAASFLMQRGSNTAFVIDTETSKLRLAHDEQLAPSGHPLDPPLCASSPKAARESSSRLGDVGNDSQPSEVTLTDGHRCRFPCAGPAEEGYQATACVGLQRFVGSDFLSWWGCGAAVSITLNVFSCSLFE